MCTFQIFLYIYLNSVFSSFIILNFPILSFIFWKITEGGHSGKMRKKNVSQTKNHLYAQALLWSWWSMIASLWWHNLIAGSIWQ